MRKWWEPYHPQVVPTKTRSQQQVLVLQICRHWRDDFSGATMAWHLQPWWICLLCCILLRAFPQQANGRLGPRSLPCGQQAIFANNQQGLVLGSRASQVDGGKAASEKRTFGPLLLKKNICPRPDRRWNLVSLAQMPNAMWRAHDGRMVEVLISTIGSGIFVSSVSSWSIAVSSKIGQNLFGKLARSSSNLTNEWQFSLAFLKFHPISCG